MKKHLMKISVIILTLIRIVLKIGSPWIVIIQSGGADDWYQAQTTLSILKGNWLGNYNWTTLSKGVSFPLFLSFCRNINIPYGLGIGLLLVITSIVASVSLSPILKKNWQKVLLYLGILYCPIFFAPSSLQIYRNTLVPIISLGVVSCAIAAYIRSDNIKQVFYWMIGEGLYLAFFWYLREDSIWILPFCVMAGLIILLKNIKVTWRKKVLYLLAIIIPGLFVFAYKTSTEMINLQHYGLKIVNDRNKTAYSDVMDLLYRIDDPENGDPDVWISKNSIRKAFDVSPTLSLLSDNLMSTRDAWADGAEKELKGDLFGFILRLIADRMGYYTSADATDAFYRKIYDELSEGFRDGRLQKKDAIYLSSLTCGFHLNDFVESFTISAQAIFGALNYNHCDINVAQINKEIDGNEYEIQEAEYLLGSNLHRSDEQMVNANRETELYEINELVKANRTQNAQISNFVTTIYRVSGYIIWPFIIACSIFLLIKKNSCYYFFLRKNIIWIVGLFIISFANICMVFLFSRWLSRDPMSNVIEYYAPSVFAFYEYLKLGMLSAIIPEMNTELRRITK